MTTVPRACPVATWAIACGVSRSGKVPAMTGVTAPASTRPLSATRSSWFCVLTVGANCWRTNIDVTMCPHGAAELAAGVPAAVRNQRSGWGERAPGLGHRLVADVVEDEVVALGARP